MTLDQQQKYHQIASLALAVLAVLFTAGLALLVPVFTTTLDSYSLLAFPFGFYMAAQGVIVVCVVVIFMGGERQEWIDRKFGAAEER